jgi:hypothetical protein
MELEERFQAIEGKKRQKTIKFEQGIYIWMFGWMNL